MMFIKNRIIKNRIIKSRIVFLICIALMASIFSGCTPAPSPVTKSGIYFDTIISITLYDKNSSELIDSCLEMASNYEQLFSKTLSGSDVSKINSSNGEYVKIAPETLYIIEKAFEYEDLSEGRFSVMCGALTDLWDISGEASDNTDSIATDEEKLDKAHSIPTEAEIEQAKSLCGRNTLDIDHDSSSVRINTPGAKLDLGAVAKGYIADKMKEFLIENGVSSGIIQLGGNVLLIGSNPVKEDGMFSIGITKPFAGNSEMITTVKETDKTIVTSGNYQRYFEADGKIYHHIIDLQTGYPAETGLNSVTIICDSSIEGDILSTVCFLLGYEKSDNVFKSPVLSGKNYDTIFVDSDNNII